MKEVEYFVKSGASYEKTYDLRKLIGSQVISKNGLIVGKISEVRVLPEKISIEGIVVGRGLLNKKLYFNSNYINQITSDAVILNIDPTELLKGMKVLTFEGEIIGNVKMVIRKGTLNDIDKLIVSALWRKRAIIPSSAIKKIGESIFLEDDYHVDKKYFWQKS
jgi:sporulation protein YlmC with PRC-barrel domain